MPTFLELVRSLARESGTLAGGVSIPTTVGVTGRSEKMVNWIRSAWVNIQNEREDWPWMQREFEGALTVGKLRYTALELGISTRFGRWKGDTPHFRTVTLYDAAIGRSDEGTLRQLTYEDWKRRYGRGAHDPNRPTDWAISPQQEFCVGATPDKAYPITGEYVASAQVLVTSEEVPELPAQYHGAIVWEAMKLLGIADESAATTSAAISEYVLARQALTRDYLPEITMSSRPLA